MLSAAFFFFVSLGSLISTSENVLLGPDNSIVIGGEPGGIQQCSDGVDNDDDGFTDYLSDQECISYEDDCEFSTPITPTNLQIVSASSSQVNLQWEDSSKNVFNGEEGFEVLRGIDLGPGQVVQFHQIAITNADENLYADNLVQIGETYHYIVRAFNCDGSSASSNSVSTIIPSEIELCGDGIIQTPNSLDLNEECDDGNTNDADGCSSSCFVENGFNCFGQPSVCSLNHPPVIDQIISNAPDVDDNLPGYQAYEGTSITYSTSASDQDGQAVSWVWALSINGGPSQDQNVLGSNLPVQPITFTYPVTGFTRDYRWTLRASDGLAIVSASFDVEVLPNPSDCHITSGNWDSDFAVNGQDVGITVGGTTACDGETVTFQVNSVSDQGADNPANIQPIEAVFVGTTATTTWEAEWFNSNGGNPEYYFIASLQSNPNRFLQSQSNELLTVFENSNSLPACSDGVDNDGDSLIDLSDPGCSDVNDNDETNQSPPPGPPAGSGGSSSSSGGGGSCTPQWTCALWNACENGQQTRACEDSRCSNPIRIEQQPCAEFSQIGSSSSSTSSQQSSENTETLDTSTRPTIGGKIILYGLLFSSSVVLAVGIFAAFVHYRNREKSLKKALEYMTRQIARGHTVDETVQVLRQYKFSNSIIKEAGEKLSNNNRNV